tara:strand:- start:936 stop:1364 length:429 start_codon:yes stop_codon:yes gene_type:complete
MSITANPKKTERPEVVELQEDDTPDYQEKIMFLIGAGAKSLILLWCLIILSLAYIKLPSKIFGMDWPDQRVDATFAAGLLGNVLAGFGISVGAGGGNKKKKNGENGPSQNSDGTPGNGPQTQTIRVEQPLIIRTEAPTTTTK